MEFPRSLFKSPGDQWVSGGSFAIEHVEDLAQYNAAKKAGWFDSVPEALDAWRNGAAAAVAEHEKMKEAKARIKTFEYKLSIYEE